jgi:hypothetical protein
MCSFADNDQYICVPLVVLSKAAQFPGLLSPSRGEEHHVDGLHRFGVRSKRSWA